MRYFIKTPWWLKKLYGSYTWSIDAKENDLYLTFDDGPHPIATPFVLDELKNHNAKGTFFCIGKNVVAHPHIYRRILDEGHAVGNHTHNHLNGWKTRDTLYLSDAREASHHIDTTLFRPPYGRITTFQGKNIRKLLTTREMSIIMWDVISGDFDESIDGEQCLKNIIMNARKGSIIVCHDSQKAFPRLEKYLPMVLKYFGEKGYQFRKIGHS